MPSTTSLHQHHRRLAQHSIVQQSCCPFPILRLPFLFLFLLIGHQSNVGVVVVARPIDGDAFGDASSNSHRSALAPNCANDDAANRHTFLWYIHPSSDANNAAADAVDNNNNNGSYIYGILAVPTNLVPVPSEVHAVLHTADQYVMEVDPKGTYTERTRCQHQLLDTEQKMPTALYSRVNEYFGRLKSKQLTPQERKIFAGLVAQPALDTIPTQWLVAMLSYVYNHWELLVQLGGNGEKMHVQLEAMAHQRGMRMDHLMPEPCEYFPSVAADDLHLAIEHLMDGLEAIEQHNNNNNNISSIVGPNQRAIREYKCGRAVEEEDVIGVGTNAAARGHDQIHMEQLKRINHLLNRDMYWRQNEAYAEAIQRKIRENPGKRLFVVIPVGHLLGPAGSEDGATDGRHTVVDLLRQRGFRVTEMMFVQSAMSAQQQQQQPPGIGAADGAALRLPTDDNDGEKRVAQAKQPEEQLGGQSMGTENANTIGGSRPLTTTMSPPLAQTAVIVVDNNVAAETTAAAEEVVHVDVEPIPIPNGDDVGGDDGVPLVRTTTKQSETPIGAWFSGQRPFVVALVAGLALACCLCLVCLVYHCCCKRRREKTVPVSPPRQRHPADQQQALPAVIVWKPDGEEHQGRITEATTTSSKPSSLTGVVHFDKRSGNLEHIAHLQLSSSTESEAHAQQQQEQQQKQQHPSGGSRSAPVTPPLLLPSAPSPSATQQQQQQQSNNDGGIGTDANANDPILPLQPMPMTPNAAEPPYSSQLLVELQRKQYEQQQQQQEQQYEPMFSSAYELPLVHWHQPKMLLAQQQQCIQEEEEEGEQQGGDEQQQQQQVPPSQEFHHADDAGGRPVIAIADVVDSTAAAPTTVEHFFVPRWPAQQLHPLYGAGDDTVGYGAHDASNNADNAGGIHADANLIMGTKEKDGKGNDGKCRQSSGDYSDFSAPEEETSKEVVDSDDGSFELSAPPPPPNTMQNMPLTITIAIVRQEQQPQQSAAAITQQQMETMDEGAVKDGATIDTLTAEECGGGEAIVDQQQQQEAEEDKEQIPTEVVVHDNGGGGEQQQEGKRERHEEGEKKGKEAGRPEITSAQEEETQERHDQFGEDEQPKEEDGKEQSAKAEMEDNVPMDNKGGKEGKQMPMEVMGLGDEIGIGGRKMLNQSHIFVQHPKKCHSNFFPLLQNYKHQQQKQQQPQLLADVPSVSTATAEAIEGKWLLRKLEEMPPLSTTPPADTQSLPEWTMAHHHHEYPFAAHHGSNYKTASGANTPQGSTASTATPPLPPPPPLTTPPTLFWWSEQQQQSEGEEEPAEAAEVIDVDAGVPEPEQPAAEEDVEEEEEEGSLLQAGAAAQLVAKAAETAEAEEEEEVEHQVEQQQDNDATTGEEDEEEEAKPPVHDLEHNKNDPQQPKAKEEEKAEVAEDREKGEEEDMQSTQTQEYFDAQ